MNRAQRLNIITKLAANQGQGDNSNLGVTAIYKMLIPHVKQFIALTDRLPPNPIIDEARRSLGGIIREEEKNLEGNHFMDIGYELLTFDRYMSYNKDKVIRELSKMTQAYPRNFFNTITGKIYEGTKVLDCFVDIYKIAEQVASIKSEIMEHDNLLNSMDTGQGNLPAGYTGFKIPTEE